MEARNWLKEKRYKLIDFVSESESRSKTLKKSVSTSASCALSREGQSALMPDQLRLFFTTLSSSDFSLKIQKQNLTIYKRCCQKIGE